MRIKYIISFIIFALFINILPAKADVTPPPFSYAYIWINNKGHITFPSAQAKREYQYNYNQNFEAMPFYDKEKEKTIYRDKNQKTVLEFDGNGLFQPLNEGLLAKFENGKYGFIDTNGNMIIKPQYMAMCYTRMASGAYRREYKCNISFLYFKEGLAPVKYDEKPIVRFSNHKYDAIIPDNFKYPENGTSIVYGEIKDNKFYLSNKETETHGYLDYEYKTGYIDKTGKIVIKTDYPVLYHFSEGLASFRTNSIKYGYINKEGKVVIKPIFGYAGLFNNGIAYVEVRTGYFLFPLSIFLLVLIVITGYMIRRDINK